MKQKVNKNNFEVVAELKAKLCNISGFFDISEPAIIDKLDIEFKLLIFFKPILLCFI